MNSIFDWDCHKLQVSNAAGSMVSEGALVEVEVLHIHLTSSNICHCMYANTTTAQLELQVSNAAGSVVSEGALV